MYILYPEFDRFDRYFRSEKDANFIRASANVASRYSFKQTILTNLILFFSYSRIFFFRINFFFPRIISDIRDVDVAHSPNAEFQEIPSFRRPKGLGERKESRGRRGDQRALDRRSKEKGGSFSTRSRFLRSSVFFSLILFSFSSFFLFSCP